MDGVLTDTASTHARAWKQTFDELLERHPGQAPFDLDADYKAYVDGKTRYDGVQSFLASRGIELPRGTADDSPKEETVSGVGNRKNELVQRLIAEDGVIVYEGSVRFVKEARASGLKTAVVSSSANTEQILESAGISDLFDVRVDGVVIANEGLNGKPAPDSFLRAAELLEHLPRPPARSSRTRSRAWRPGGPGTSGSWWAWTATATPRRCSTTAPTSW